jgi:hypothetical protein
LQGCEVVPRAFERDRARFSGGDAVRIAVEPGLVREAFHRRFHVGVRARFARTILERFEARQPSVERLGETAGERFIRTRQPVDRRGVFLVARDRVREAAAPQRLRQDRRSQLYRVLIALACAAGEFRIAKRIGLPDEECDCSERDRPFHRFGRDAPAACRARVYCVNGIGQTGALPAD